MPSAKHNARTAAQTRAWRLALLLTGADDLAAEVAIQVRRAQPKLESLDPRRLDRLTVIRSREVVQAARRRRSSRAATSAAPDAVLDAPGEARLLLAALAAIEEQPREAWIFARLDNLDAVEVARSMDCSKTATARYLTEADTAIARAFRAAEAGEAGALAPHSAASDLPSHIHAVRTWLATLSPYESIEARLAIHRRRRRVWLGLWLLLAAAIITAGLLLLAWL